MTSLSHTTAGKGDLALIGPGKTFLPLLAVQQLSHGVGYNMSVRQYASASEATAASLAARMRLRRCPIAIAAPKPAAIAPVAKPPARHGVRNDKFLNMLLPCSYRFLLVLASIKHGVPVKKMISPSRTKPTVAARDEAMALIYQHTQSSLPQVGKMFYRDHTTVIHGMRKLGVTGKFVDPREGYNGGTTPPRQLPPAIVVAAAPVELDGLIEQNRQLRAYIGTEPDREFQSAAAALFGISPTQCRILQMLMTGKVQSTAALLSGSTVGFDYSVGALKVQISRLRKTLAFRDVQIRSQFAHGYSMLEHDRLRVTSLLEEKGL